VLNYSTIVEKFNTEVGRFPIPDPFPRLDGDNARNGGVEALLRAERKSKNSGCSLCGSGPYVNLNQWPASVTIRWARSLRWIRVSLGVKAYRSLTCGQTPSSVSQARCERGAGYERKSRKKTVIALANKEEKGRVPGGQRPFWVLLLPQGWTKPEGCFQRR